MRTSTRRTMLALALGLAMTATGAPAAAGQTAAAAGARTAAPYCGITWGSGAKTGGDLRAPGLLTVTTTQDSCWDRTTFEFAGPVDGYSVAYSTEVPTEGEGLDLVPFTAGGAHLAVSLRAPATTFPARAGSHPANVLRYPTLRDVVYGGSFEGYSTFAVGVRARLPFRVLVAAGPGTRSRIIIDVAHQW